MPASSLEAFSQGIQAVILVRDRLASDAILNLESGLVHLMNDLPATRDVLRQILHTRSAHLLAGLFDIHGSSAYASIQNDPEQQLSLAPLFDEERYDLLRILHRAGCKIDSDESSLLTRLLGTSSTELLELVFVEMDRCDIALPEYPTAMIRAIKGDAGAWLGAFLERQEPSFHEACVRNVLRANTGKRHVTSKAIAYALWANIDLLTCLANDIEAYHPKLRDLLLATASAHGRLELRRREPSLASLMARPSDGEFYGLTDKALNL